MKSRLDDNKFKILLVGLGVASLIFTSGGHCEELSEGAINSLRVGLLGNDYQEDVKKCYGLDEYRLKRIMPMPGVVRTNLSPVEDAQTKKAQQGIAKDFNLTSIKHKIQTARIASPYQIIPPENYSDSELKLLGEPPASAVVYGGSKIGKYYRISKCRPILPLNKGYSDVRSMFVVKTGDGPGMEQELAAKVEASWHNLQNLRGFMIRFDYLQGSGFAMGFYVGNGRILTADHVKKAMGKDTVAVWVGLPGSPESKIQFKGAPTTPVDMAMVFTDEIPEVVKAGEEVHRQFIEESIKAGDQASKGAVALLSCPMDYGRINGHAFDLIFKEKKIPRACPGMMLEDDASAMQVIHDCPSMETASGSAVINLTTGLLVGVHVGGDEIKKNRFVPISKTNLLKVQRDL
jgi:hypothetical protein